MALKKPQPYAILQAQSVNDWNQEEIKIPALHGRRTEESGLLRWVAVGQTRELRPD